jgi:preprotein translocase subunit SecA
MFSSLLDHIKYEVIGILAKVQVAQEEDVDAIDEQRQALQEMHYEHAEVSPVQEEPEPQALDNQEPAEQPFVRDVKKIGRNDPCPCGSKKKYKQCHGKLT